MPKRGAHHETDETGFLRAGSDSEDARIEERAEQEMIVAIVR
jgi:hypothetical protein